MEGLRPQSVTVAAIAFLAGVYLLRSRTASRARCPPGPSGLPLLGNILQAPGKHLATYFRRLCEEYGGFVALNLAGFATCVPDWRHQTGKGDPGETIRQVLITSHHSLPRRRYHVDPAQVYWSLYEQNETHFIGRRLTAGLMAAVRAGETEPLQQFEALLNITHLIDDRGKNWFNHIDRVSASMVLAAAFGLHCPTGQEPDLKEVIACIAEFVTLSSPSGSIMNVLPFLDMIPGPMPWRTRAKTYRRREDALYDRLITRAVSGEASGMNTWAAAFAREDKPEGDQRRLVNQFTTAAIDTACGIFISPREIDAIVGEDRLPSFQDRPHLPYVEAIVRETLRWRPAARLGAPHQSTADDVVEYEGREYFIPDGSIIIAVTWAIEHNQERFKNHDLFQPERFLDDTNSLKAGYETSAFGFGRRGKLLLQALSLKLPKRYITACPGIPFAERSLWINIAMILWTFNIRRSGEPDPKTSLPFKYDDSDSAFSGDFTNTPFRFPAVFEPRSMQRAEVVRQEWAYCEKDLNVLLPRHEER
ncbi:Cytochrome P450 2B19 [Mycena sanguinolenta]|uniref:Cytochrome P450 2B19 n=1 Tax=Mycena sanguinolenta TaxID=230812 RepID=A0A8H6X7Z7_9AGAR|nr:Cytochrome P450 2B19 [Mycena sanguinolenta]